MGQRAKGAGAEDRLMLCATGLERARGKREGEREQEGERGLGGVWVGGSGASELRSFSGEAFLGGMLGLGWWGSGQWTGLDWMQGVGVLVVSVTPVCVSPSFGGAQRD